MEKTHGYCDNLTPRPRRPQSLVRRRRSSEARRVGLREQPRPRSGSTGGLGARANLRRASRIYGVRLRLGRTRAICPQVDPSSDNREPSPLEWSAHDPFAHAAQVLIARMEDAAIERFEANLLLLHSDRRVFVLLRYARQLEPA